MTKTQEAAVVDGMACAMWIDYAAGGGTRCTPKDWATDYGDTDRQSKDGFRRSARVALKAYRKTIEGIGFVEGGPS